MVKITDSDTAPNVFLHGMHKSAFPIPVAHKEGRASFKTASSSAQQLVDSGRVAIRYVNNGTLEPTEKYPANPNGSPLGIAAVSSSDGRLVNTLFGCAVSVACLLTDVLESWLSCPTQNGPPCLQAGFPTARRKSGDTYCLGSGCSTRLVGGFRFREACRMFTLSCTALADGVGYVAGCFLW